MRAWRDPSISEIIGAGAGSVIVIGAVGMVLLLTYLRAWRTLWTEWFTSLDHKKIGIMYIVLAGVMLSRALIEAVLIRVQQATAVNAPGLVEPNHFAQLFSTHGSIMIFFMAMPFLTGSGRGVCVMAFWLPVSIKDSREGRLFEGRSYYMDLQQQGVFR